MGVKEALKLFKMRRCVQCVLRPPSIPKTGAWDALVNMVLTG